MPAFQRRHYTIIADLLRESIDSREGALFSALEATETVDRYVRVFAHDNPNFDPTRFRVACGLSLASSSSTRNR